jgi:exodeoxyribonuclease-3
LPKQKFTLLSWNVNGIRSAEKKGFLTWINAVGADLICVQETKAHPEQLTPRSPESGRVFYVLGLREPQGV